jgi:hypothetical protein
MLQLPAKIPRFFQNKADDLLTYLTLKYLEVVVKAIKEHLIKTITRKIEIKKTSTDLKLHMHWRIQNQGWKTNLHVNFTPWILWHHYFQSPQVIT